MEWMVWLLAACVLLGILGIFRSIWESSHFEITEYTVQDPCFAENKGPIKTVFISDLHNHIFGRDNEQLLAAISQIAPACIFVGGDMPVANPGRSIEPAARFMEALADRYPIYYGIGNHEYRMRLYPDIYGNAYEDYDDRLKASGIFMLHNEERTAVLGNVKAQVYGLEMERRFYRRFRKNHMDKAYLDKTLPKPEGDGFKILLAHSPDYFDAYCQWGADLILSGHIHGGIIRIGRRGIFSPSTGLFPRYSGGMYERDGRRMLVSRGLGGHTIPLRLFNRPELIVLTFEDAVK